MVRCLGVLDSLTELRCIADWEPDIVFNLLEEFDGIVTYDRTWWRSSAAPALCGTTARTLLSRDKSYASSCCDITASPPAVRRVSPRRAFTCRSCASCS
jgi:hypothetical protein